MPGSTASGQRDRRDPDRAGLPMMRRGPPGFTLVEVLVALVVMAIMAVMAWQGVDGIVRARDASQGRLEQTMRLNTIIAQWEQDLASIQSSGGTVTQPLMCDGATVRMTRRTPTGLQVVAWSLRPDEAASVPGTAVWQRWAGPPVTTNGELADSWVRSQQIQGDLPGTIRALDGVSQWQVYFYVNNAWANCQSSLDSNTSVPQGVRLVLSFAPESGVAGKLTRDMVLLAQ